MWRNRDLVSLTDFTRREIEKVFKQADIFLEAKLTPLRLLDGKILAAAFFEPSTRTRLSFEAAMHRLGGDVIGFSSVEGTSLAKGESVEDTVRMLDNYSDIIVVRHGEDGIMRKLAKIAEHPVVNAGEGQSSHPTQTLIDLYTIIKEKKSVEGLSYGVMGDLKHARTAKDFMRGLSIFGVKEISLIAPSSLMPREEFLKELEEKGVTLRKYGDIEKAIGELDILYVVRLQVERFSDINEAERLKKSYVITAKKLERARKSLMVLHPLPRVDEVSSDVDSTPHAAYFKQVFYSIPVRMAVLSLILTDVEKLEEGLI
ncbi:MAG: aspartate carbamoyltransferase [Thermoproteota archaeon]